MVADSEERLTNHSSTKGELQYCDRLNHLMQSRLIPKRSRVSYLQSQFESRNIEITKAGIRKWFTPNGGEPSSINEGVLKDILDLTSEELAYLSGYIETPSKAFNIDSLHHTVQSKLYIDIYQGVKSLGFNDLDEILDESQQELFFEAIFKKASKNRDFEITPDILSRYLSVFSE